MRVVREGQDIYWAVFEVGERGMKMQLDWKKGGKGENKHFVLAEHQELQIQMPTEGNVKVM